MGCHALRIQDAAGGRQTRRHRPTGGALERARLQLPDDRSSFSQHRGTGPNAEVWVRVSRA